MSKLILISGWRGVGKSETAKKYTDRSIVLHADEIRREITVKGLPYLKRAEICEHQLWSKFRELFPKLHLEPLFDLALITLSPELHSGSNNGFVIVEGAALHLDHFRDSDIDSLRRYGFQYENNDVHLFHLAPEPQAVLKNIHKRAEESPGRSSEKIQFPDLESIIEKYKRFNELFATGNWTKISSIDEMYTQLNQLFSLE